MRAQEGRGGNRRRIVRGVAGLALGGLVTAAVGVTLAGRWGQQEPVLAWLRARAPGVGAASPVASATASPAPAPSPSSDSALAQARAIVNPAAPPSRLVIPAIGVNAVVEQVGLDAQGRMGAPSESDHVAWFSPGTAPGDVGDAVIDGHLDWTNGPAVFWQLGKLRPGDEVTVVRADGTKARFLADSVTTLAYTASTDALFTRQGPPSLSLITCAGAWDRARGTYLQRLVVHTSLAPSVIAGNPGAGAG